LKFNIDISSFELQSILNDDKKNHGNYIKLFIIVNKNYLV